MDLNVSSDVSVMSSVVGIDNDWTEHLWNSKGDQIDEFCPETEQEQL